MNSHLTLFDIYQKNALLHQDRAALHFDQETQGFGALFEQTCRLAAGLADLNLAPGTRVAVLAKNHPAFFHLLGAASALNLCLVLINRRLSKEEIAYIVEDTGPRIVICDKEMEEIALALVQELACLERSFTVEESLASLYQDKTFTPSSSPSDDQPYAIIHTAAVQGKPRGAVLSQRNLILSSFQLIHALGLDMQSAYLNLLPLFHIMGLNLGLALVMTGGKNVIIEKFTPQESIDLIQEQKITIFGSFPPILTNLYDLIQAQKSRLPSLKTVAGLETPDMVKKWEAATASRFWTMYGQTETSGLVSFAPYFEQPGSAGRITPLAHIVIADDQDQILGLDATGEILVKGPLVFQGYWQADDLTAFTFRRGWHHTGDLGMIDSQGYLHFKGRKAEKELIKPGGENVFPAEVENAILTHEAVASVCVFGVPDPKFGEGIKAVVALHPGASLTAEELVAFTGSLIAGYKKPRYVEFVETLPKTAAGEVDREKVKKLHG